MKVTVENYREHDITIHMPNKAETIPASRQDPEDHNKTIVGTAEIDGEFLDAATKHSTAVQQYFKNGWLRRTREDQNGKKKE